MSDRIDQLARLAAAACFRRNRSRSDEERRRFDAMMAGYVEDIAAERSRKRPD